MIINNLYPVKNSLLSPFIKNYQVIDFSQLPTDIVELKVPPIGYPVLQFHYGITTNFYNHKHLTCESLFIGQCSRHIILYPSCGVKLIGVNFKPYGLYNLFGISAHSILNSGIESRFFFGAENINYITEILKKGDIETSIMAIEDLLLSFQNKSIKISPYFDELVDKMENENGLINFTNLLDKSVSLRTLQRYFKETIGISPKLFNQILRHKYILQLLYQNPTMTWQDIQLNGFYYDFSHFTKDFAHFTGLNPKQYLHIKNNFASAIINNK